MLRFKWFSGRGDEIEQAVNAWLEEFEPDVTQMVQTVNPDGSVYMGLLFEESFRGQELRLSAERGARSKPPVPASSIPDRPIEVPVEPGSLQE